MVRIERGLLTGNHDSDFCVVLIAYVVVEVDHAIFLPRFQVGYINSLKSLGGILQVSNERLARHDENQKRVLFVQRVLLGELEELEEGFLESLVVVKSE